MNQPHASLYTGPLEIPSNPSLPFHPSKSSQSPELGKNHFKVEVIAASLPWLNVMFVQFRYCRCLSWYPFILLSFHRIFFRKVPLKHPVCSVYSERRHFSRSQLGVEDGAGEVCPRWPLWWWPAGDLAWKWAEAWKGTLGGGVWGHHALLLLWKGAPSLYVWIKSPGPFENRMSSLTLKNCPVCLPSCLTTIPQFWIIQSLVSSLALVPATPVISSSGNLVS